jgi:ABC-type polysaccharide/polyol phosphate transport system ATPase subunit
MIDLSFEGVSKRYLVRHEADEDATLHPWIRKLKALRQPREEFWALRDVSFAVERGQTLGIIGHNGAGKSTMLKLLASITSPTTGRIAINGRLSALIEVGSGFHPELTGRENIFLNGAILGMRRKEIAAKLDSIVEFAGVRQFLDVPVKRFSSGMYVRLGFSIAAHLDPDILLLDEVLAVGDAAFQEKCLARIEDLKRAGTTILFISHDLGAVHRVCDRAILLRRGNIVADGDPLDVIEEYRHHAAPRVARTVMEDPATQLSTSLHFLPGEDRRQDFARTGAPLAVRVEYSLRSSLKDVVFEVLLYTPDKTVIAQLSTEDSDEPVKIGPGRGAVEFRCAELGLLPGLFYADVKVRVKGAPDALHLHDRAGALRVEPGKQAKGLFFQPHEWSMAVTERESLASAI